MVTGQSEDGKKFEEKARRKHGNSTLKSTSEEEIYRKYHAGLGLLAT